MRAGGRVVAVEVVVEPIVVPVPAVAIPVEAADVQVTIRVANMQNAFCATAHRRLFADLRAVSNSVSKIR